VDPALAQALHGELTAAHVARPLAITGLALWRYLGGPWEPLGAFSPGPPHDEPVRR
jgi:hypothetical protein